MFAAIRVETVKVEVTNPVLEVIVLVVSEDASRDETVIVEATLTVLAEMVDPVSVL